MAPDPDEVARLRGTVEAFVLRARRVVQHSLVADPEVIAGLAKVEIKLEVIDGDDLVTFVETLPPEEQFESLAARVRPLVLNDDPVFYMTALKALSRLAYLAGDQEVVTYVKHLRGLWRDADPGQGHGMYYGLQRGSTDGSVPNATADDRTLALAWYYGDLVHADADRRQSVEGFSITDRFQSAVSHVARLCLVCLDTLEFIEWLHRSSTLPIADRVFEEKVTVTESEIRRRGRVFYAPVGTDAPSDITQPFGEGWVEGVPGVERPSSPGVAPTALDGQDSEPGHSS